MSYLVDALKKAERERHINQRADLRSLAEGEPPPHGLTTGRALRWLVALLVICNAALLVYLFVPTPVSEAFVAPLTDDAAAEQTSPTSAAKNGSAADPEQRLQTVEAPTAGADGVAATRDGKTVKGSAPAAAQSMERQDNARTARDDASRDTRPSGERNGDNRRSLRLSDDARPSRGRVTYSQSPLDDTPEWRDGSLNARADTDSNRARDSAGPGAPDITVNGHLFSSVPGRSFILVNGRRYHEGQRLSAGPAIESIDATGATLNYRGQRYHVEGPR